jgi:hypothetical protein
LADKHTPPHTQVGLVAAIALCGVIACIAIIATHTGSPTELGAKSQHAHKVHKSLGLKHQVLLLRSHPVIGSWEGSYSLL